MTRLWNKIKCYLGYHNRDGWEVLSYKQVAKCLHCEAEKERSLKPKIQVTVGSVTFIEDKDLKRPNPRQ